MNKKILAVILTITIVTVSAFIGLKLSETTSNRDSATTPNVNNAKINATISEFNKLYLSFPFKFIEKGEVYLEDGQQIPVQISEEKIMLVNNRTQPLPSGLTWQLTVEITGYRRTSTPIAGGNGATEDELTILKQETITASDTTDWLGQNDRQVLWLGNITYVSGYLYYYTMLNYTLTIEGFYPITQWYTI
jgi:hypothetical protein